MSSNSEAATIKYTSLALLIIYTPEEREKRGERERERNQLKLLRKHVSSFRSRQSRPLRNYWEDHCRICLVSFSTQLCFLMISTYFAFWLCFSRKIKCPCCLLWIFIRFLLFKGSMFCEVLFWITLSWLCFCLRVSCYQCFDLLFCEFLCEDVMIWFFLLIYEYLFWLRRSKGWNFV